MEMVDRDNPSKSDGVTFSGCQPEQAVDLDAPAVCCVMNCHEQLVKWGGSINGGIPLMDGL
jgi:hypothetical protein